MATGEQQATILRARSISRSVWDWLSGKLCHGQVRAVFERTCLLETAGGELVALVLSPIGNGPLNVVVDGRPGLFAALESGAPVSRQGDRLLVGSMAVSIEGASVWEPRPNWEALRARWAAIAGRLPPLRDLAVHHAPAASLLALASQPRHPKFSKTSGVCGEEPAGAVTARAGTEALVRGWAGDTAALKAGAARLAGLGVGLTPAGDDFLAGFMLRAWLAHPDPGRLCRGILEAAAARTTTLSAAFLRAAAGGLCSEPWHDLLSALASGREGRLEAAVRAVLAYGSTSGADTLAGFLLID